MIESDHKPLEMIQGKPLAAAPARLQRMLLRMQGYDCTIKYRPGSEMTLADCLSRLPTRNRDPEIPLDVQVSLVQFSSPRLEELRRATREDPVLSHLMEYIATGFPATRRDTHSSTHDYWSFRDELSIEDGLVLKGTRVVIPEKLRDQFIKDVHAGHQGVTRRQQRARTCIYWPGIDKAIADHASTCTPCQQYQSSQPKETLMPVIPDLPNIPWHTLGTDLFTLIGDNYLIILDYHTKYLVVEKLGADSTSKRVADLTSNYFSLFGVPNTIISDNGPQFVGAAYQSLLQEYGVTHITSSPWHPESHGFIERAIRTAKSMLRKSPRDSDLALLVFRTTPPGPQEPSPAEMLFGRKVPSNLPTQVRPPAHSRSAREQEALTPPPPGCELPDLHIGQPVYYQDTARRMWFPGEIMGVGPEPRSYHVRCSQTERFLRRNRVMLRPRSTTTPAQNLAMPPQLPPSLEDKPRDNSHKAAGVPPAVPQTPKKPVTLPTPPPKAAVTSSAPAPGRASEATTSPSQIRRSNHASHPTRRLIETI